MYKYKVYEAEEKTTQTGKKLKKLVLQREGAQHPTKNVTVWGDNPLYKDCVPGQEITCVLLEKDSGVPNPKAPGKNYIDRTVANPNQPTLRQGVSNNSQLTEMAIKTHIDRAIQSLRADLKVIADHLGVEPPKKTLPNTEVEYPEEEIKPEDIPF